jgi:hypothetical protein
VRRAIFPASSYAPTLQSLHSVVFQIAVVAGLSLILRQSATTATNVSLKEIIAKNMEHRTEIVCIDRHEGGLSRSLF